MIIIKNSLGNLRVNIVDNIGFKSIFIFVLVLLKIIMVMILVNYIFLFLLFISVLLMYFFKIFLMIN